MPKVVVRVDESEFRSSNPEPNNPDGVQNVGMYGIGTRDAASLSRPF